MSLFLHISDSQMEHEFWRGVSAELCPPDRRYFSNLSVFRGERTNKRVSCAKLLPCRCIYIVPYINVIIWTRVGGYELMACVGEKRIACRILEESLKVTTWTTFVVGWG
jgi:hypothetical protein